MVIKIKYTSIFTYSDKVPFPLNHKILKLIQFHTHTKYNYIEFVVSYRCVRMVAMVRDGKSQMERERMCVCLYERICKSYF